MSGIMLQQYLASSALFSDLPTEALRVFSNAGSFAEVPSGEILFKEGDRGDSFFLLVRGSVDALIGNRRVGQIGEGGFFGEIALLTKGFRTATIRTTEPSVVFKIEGPQFWKIILENMNLALGIETIAEQRLVEEKNLVFVGGKV